MSNNTDNFRINRKSEEEFKFDPYAHALTVIQEQHRLSHDGFMFHASGKVASVANAADYEFILAVPAGTFPHLQRFSLNVEAGDIDVVIYEGPTASADGTGITVTNTNRNSANTADSVLTHTPTTSADGTLIHTQWVPPTGAGVGNSAGVLDITLGEEWLLAPATKYLFRLTNNSGGAIAVRYEFVFYEIGYES